MVGGGHPFWVESQFQMIREFWTARNYHDECAVGFRGRYGGSWLMDVGMI